TYPNGSVGQLDIRTIPGLVPPGGGRQVSGGAVQPPDAGATLLAASLLPATSGPPTAITVNAATGPPTEPLDWLTSLSEGAQALAPSTSKLDTHDQTRFLPMHVVQGNGLGGDEFWVPFASE